MSRARFPVSGRLDESSRAQDGTVTIDRTTSTFAVRPKRRRREYVLPLAFVAGMVARHVMRIELQERRTLGRSALRRRR